MLFIVSSLPYQFLQYNSGYSTHVKQPSPTFASWSPVQVSAGNQILGTKTMSLSVEVIPTDYF